MAPGLAIECLKSWAHHDGIMREFISIFQCNAVGINLKKIGDGRCIYLELFNRGFLESIFDAVQIGSAY